jgi:hypothetical protein
MDKTPTTQRGVVGEEPFAVVRRSSGHADLHQNVAVRRHRRIPKLWGEVGSISVNAEGDDRVPAG